MKAIENIMNAVNNNAAIGLQNIVREAKDSYEYRRGGSLLYVINHTISRTPFTDEPSEFDNAMYREGYSYACGYVD